VRIGTPSGVGDVYWVLTKLRAFLAQRRADRVTLCVQKSRLTRALDWSKMVDFVDATEEFPFRADEQALATGYSDGVEALPMMSRQERRELRRELRQKMPAHLRRRGAPLPPLPLTPAPPGPPLDCVLWPNAVLDRGDSLRDWLPGLELDLSFKIRTDPGPSDRIVVYASSAAINEAWIPGLGPEYWAELIAAIAERTGDVPTLIGAPWDATFRERIACEVEDLLGVTTLPQVAGILERASVVVGVICGMTILANHFRTPTVALYPDKFHPAFPTSWVAPDAPYLPIAASRVPPARELAARVAELARPACASERVA
jgi:hypothetical protein